MRRYLIVAALVVVAALFTGAFLGPRLFTSPIATAEERWFASPRSDYTMTLERKCFCPSPQTYTVTVRSG